MHKTKQNWIISSTIENLKIQLFVRPKGWGLEMNPFKIGQNLRVNEWRIDEVNHEKENLEGIGSEMVDFWWKYSKFV